MRLDKALGHQKVTFHSQPIDVETGAGGQLSHGDKVLGSEGIVDHNVLMVYDLVAEHFALLGLSGGPVEAGGDEDGDLCIGVSGPDLLQEDRECDFAGHSPGMIAGHDDDAALACCQVSEPGTSNWIGQSFLYQSSLTHAGVIVVDTGSQNSLHRRFLHMERHDAGMVRYGYFSHNGYSLVP